MSERLWSDTDEERFDELFKRRYGTVSDDQLTDPEIDELDELWRRRDDNEARIEGRRLARLGYEAALDVLTEGIGLVPGALAEMTFESFIAGSDALRRARDAAVAYARRPRGTFVLAGSVGSGKTHLAVAALREARRDEFSLHCFLSWPQLLEELKASFASEGSPAVQEAKQALVGAQLLVMDDIGLGQVTPWIQQLLFQFVDYRYSRALPTIVTTNLDISRQEGPVGSRLRDWQRSTVVSIDARDYRIHGPYVN